MGASVKGKEVCQLYIIAMNRMLIPVSIDSWLYTLFLALDGNFRMSRKGVSSKERDPCLTEGHGYFVNDDELAAHLEAHKGKPQEVRQIPNGRIIVLIS
jgi:hypothetical protein